MIGTLRASDVVARVEHDRFVAVLPGASSDDAPKVAETLRRAIAEACVASALAKPLSVSIGVVSYPEHAREAGPLLAAVSEALTRARSQGEGLIAIAPMSTIPLRPSIVPCVN